MYSLKFHRHTLMNREVQCWEVHAAASPLLECYCHRDDWASKRPCCLQAPTTAIRPSEDGSRAPAETEGEARQTPASGQDVVITTCFFFDGRLHSNVNRAVSPRTSHNCAFAGYPPHAAGVFLFISLTHPPHQTDSPSLAFTHYYKVNIKGSADMASYR